MKKSLLVVPALGVMLLAAAGSVGGTVAWFSSVSSVEVAANSFQAIALDGNLVVAVGAGNGTTVESGTKIAKVAAGDRLTHASYDYEAGTIYTVSSETGSKVRKVVDSESTSWIAKENFSGTNDIYWAVSWTLTFTYTFATEESVYLFFDPKSSFDISTAEEAATPVGIDSTEGAHNTINGFRVAFIGEQNASGSATTANNVANSRVWGNKRTSTNYIKNANVAAKDTAGTDYRTGEALDSSVFIGSGFNTKHAEGSPVSEDKSASLETLGVFKHHDSADTSVIKFTCVAWFEGTDADIVSDPDHSTIMNTVTANMKFYTRENTYTGA